MAAETVKEGKKSRSIIKKQRKFCFRARVDLKSPSMTRNPEDEPFQSRTHHFFPQLFDFWRDEVFYLKINRMLIRNRYNLLILGALFSRKIFAFQIAKLNIYDLEFRIFTPELQFSNRRPFDCFWKIHLLLLLVPLRK